MSIITKLLIFPNVCFYFDPRRLPLQLTPSVQETVKAQRHLRIKGEANPFDREWDGYFQRRDRQLALQASSRFRATVLTRQKGLRPVCRQVIQCEEELELHHRDHNHQNNRIGNLELLHPNCHRQLHYAPVSRTESTRPAGALVMLGRSAGKLARYVLRGRGGCESSLLPGGVKEFL